MKKSSLLLISCIAFMLSSCHIYKEYSLPTDNSYVKTFDESVNAEKDSTSLPYLSWEKVFTDPILKQYIRTALDNNKDLDNALKNIDVARAQLQGAKLSYFPLVALGPNGGISKFQGMDWTKWSYTIPASVQWEIDIFAKILNRKRGAKVGVDLMEEYKSATQSQLVCGVASCYYTLMLLNQQLDLTERTAVIWKDQVESMKLMKTAGRVNEAAVVQSAANYWNIMGTIPDLKNQIRQVQNSMSLLLHSYPKEWEVSDNMDFSLPVDLSKGMPITYLGARPDVRAAERKLASAYYTTNSARAAFYPGLSISANGGFTNLLGQMVSNPGKWFISLAGSLAAPLFSRGQNIANLKVAKIQQQQAMNDFEKAVLSASADVSNALADYNYSIEKRECIMQQIDQLEKSVEYTQELLMLDPKTTYLEVLTARSSLLSAQMASLAAWHTKVAALISLYQNAGGGR